MLFGEELDAGLLLSLCSCCELEGCAGAEGVGGRLDMMQFMVQSRRSRGQVRYRWPAASGGYAEWELFFLLERGADTTRHD